MPSLTFLGSWGVAPNSKCTRQWQWRGQSRWTTTPPSPLPIYYLSITRHRPPGLELLCSSAARACAFTGFSQSNYPAPPPHWHKRTNKWEVPARKTFLHMTWQILHAGLSVSRFRRHTCIGLWYRAAATPPVESVICESGFSDVRTSVLLSLFYNSYTTDA